MTTDQIASALGITSMTARLKSGEGEEMTVTKVATDPFGDLFVGCQFTDKDGVCKYGSYNLKDLDLKDRSGSTVDLKTAIEGLKAVVK